MSFAWLKRYVPRSLYGRAALILLVPVVAIQLVVSVVFIQRHFEGVTRQMTGNVVLELRYLLDRVRAAESLSQAEAAVGTLEAPLDLQVELPAQDWAEADSRRFYDFSGRVVIDVLRQRLDNVTSVDLATSTRDVSLILDTGWGPMSVEFDRRRVSASNPHQLLVLMMFASAVLTIISFIFLRNQLRPIKRLSAAAEAFGKGRVVPYKPSGATEVRLAGGAFLDMRSRIERQIEQRTMMLSGVSHDLRTPITRLKLGLSMMDETAETAELGRDVRDMERLLDEFLAFARGDALDDAEPVDPVELVSDSIDRAQRGGGRADLVAVEGEGTAMLRPMAFSRALDNLIGNALRYGNRAEVRVAIMERSLRVTIEDDGPGIPRDQRDQALKPFARLDSARNQDRGSGVGLGLSIANDIARRHGGSIRLSESGRLGGLRVDLVLAR